MTAGIDFNYFNLPYQYPLTNNQPVIRIPVAGPAPYNTVAIVRGTGNGFASPSNGDVHRFSAVTSTTFHLAQFDQRVGTPPPQHSTTLSIQLTEFDTSCEFLLADDLITGYFDPMGVWTVQVEIADKADGHEVLGTYGYNYSSWVLCYEPPVQPAPGGRRWPLSGQETPNRGIVLPLPARPGDRRRVARKASPAPPTLCDLSREVRRTEIRPGSTQ